MKKFLKVFSATCFVSFFVGFSAVIVTGSMVHHPEVYAVPQPRNNIVAEIFSVDLEPLQGKPLPPYMVYYTDPIELSKRDRDCLARNIFYEAGIESLQGKLAVAQITWNRVQHPKRWGNTVCQAVYRKNQFSWTNDPKKRDQRPHGKLWKESLAAADMFIAGSRIMGLDDSYYYHAEYVKPKWTNKLERIVQIDTHIFYQYAKK